MSKAVLLSIRPEWCKKILSGEKTVEVRRTCPVHGTPFKAYIYCTRTASKEFKLDDQNWDVSAKTCGGCGWHISDLKVYDKPRGLDEFSRFGFFGMGYSNCVCGNWRCENYEPSDNRMEPPTCKINGCSICRPPQSWFYVEDAECTS